MWYDGSPQYTDVGWQPILKNEIKTANPSDLFVDVSLECGVDTFTEAKSKGGNRDTASSMTGVKVRVIIEKGTDFWRMMDPGYVSFCRRSKELSAVFQGILEAPLADGCWVDVLNPDTGEFVDGYWDKLCLLDNCLVIKDDRTVFAEGCLTEKEVSLMLATMNVNAFNFIIADLGPGEHTITVKAMVDSLTDWGAGSAEARATIGKGSVAGEEVKMIKEEDVNGEAVP